MSAQDTTSTPEPMFVGNVRAGDYIYEGDGYEFEVVRVRRVSDRHVRLSIAAPFAIGPRPTDAVLNITSRVLVSRKGLQS